MGRTNTAIDHFVHVENVNRFRKQLTETVNPAERLQLLRLLEEEEAKGPLPASTVTAALTSTR